MSPSASRTASMSVVARSSRSGSPASKNGSTSSGPVSIRIRTPTSAAPASAICRARSDWEPSRREPPIPSTLIVLAEVTLSRLTPPLKWISRLWDRGPRHSWTCSLLASNIPCGTAAQEATMAIPLPVRVQAAASQLAFWLPAPLRRAVAGRPVRLDGQDLALDAQLLLRLQKLAGAELVQGSVERSRAQLDPGRRLVSGKPIEPVSVREIAVPTPDGDLPTTLYTPAGLPEKSPLLVFFHGGGWVIGTRASHDNAVRFLATHAGVRELSIEYRLAPEFPFPAATEDALAAFEYAVAKAGDLGAAPARIAVGGASAGGNLAAVTAQQAVRRGGPVPAFPLLIYPATDFARRYRSQDLFAEDLFLTDVHMKWI